MPDINKFIGDQSTWSEERENQLDLEEWNESIATGKAAELGLELGEGHWEVVRFLRAHYLEHGPARARAPATGSTTRTTTVSLRPPASASLTSSSNGS